MFQSLDISTSGLVAQRRRMDTIAENIANARTTRDAQGQPVPFQRRLVTFQPAATDPRSQALGVGVSSRVEVDRQTPPQLVLEPGHPDADENGYVKFPNINLITEYVNAMESSRAYEANLAAMNLSKQMIGQSLQILQ